MTALQALQEVIDRQVGDHEDTVRELGEAGPWVFSCYGERVGDFRYAWNTARVAAGLPGLLFHDLRRSAVVNLERAGVARSVAMSITGHKTESVYTRYAIADTTAQAEAFAKLEGT